MSKPGRSLMSRYAALLGWTILNYLEGGINFVVFLDRGHGAGDETPSRIFTHPNGRVVREGDINRDHGKVLASELRKQGVAVFDVCHDIKDTPLEDRVSYANRMWKVLGRPPALFLSLHANASPDHNGTGCEGYTYPGDSEADHIYTNIYDGLHDAFGREIEFRSGWSDGDPDKEAKFYVLKHTQMPAILWEGYFYDNPSDYHRYSRPDFIEPFYSYMAYLISEYAQNRSLWTM